MLLSSVKFVTKSFQAFIALHEQKNTQHGFLFREAKVELDNTPKRIWWRKS